ncbi:MAG: hypothetical protein ACLTDX_17675 [[Clostridium] innocuum]
MNSTAVRTAIASMVLGIVSVSLCVPAILLSFFWWLLGMLVSACFLGLRYPCHRHGYQSQRCYVRQAERLPVWCWDIIGTSIAGLLLLCLLLLRIIL